MADYLVFAKKPKMDHSLLTENRTETIKKRECSMESIIANYTKRTSNREDTCEVLSRTDAVASASNVILSPKVSITQKDLDTIPTLSQLRETINQWEDRLKKTGGREAYIMKKAIIEMRKQQYVIKQAYQKPFHALQPTPSSPSYFPLDDTSYMNGFKLVVQGISLMNPKVVSAILINYSRLKQDSFDSFNGDLWYLMQDFDSLATRALEPYPAYNTIAELKVDGKENAYIQKVLKKEYNTSYSIEYISSLWRNKIPFLIAKQAQEDFITHEYEIRNWPMKVCTRCGTRKPAHNQFFSYNRTSADGFYSICKSCRRRAVSRG